MSDAGPVRQQRDLADALELILDKGIVINADIAVTVGQTELLGVEIRAAIASFETAAEYGLEFPSGTDMRRVAQASGRDPLDADERVDIALNRRERGRRSVARRPAPTPIASDLGEPFQDEEESEDDSDDEEEAESDGGADA